jgi:hypothetical protein
MLPQPHRRKASIRNRMREMTVCSSQPPHVICKARSSPEAQALRGISLDPLEVWYVLRFGTAEDLYALRLRVLDLSLQPLDRIPSRFILGFGLLRAKLFKLSLHLDEHRVIIVVHHRCSLLGAAVLFFGDGQGSASKLGVGSMHSHQHPKHRVVHATGDIGFS